MIKKIRKEKGAKMKMRDYMSMDQRFGRLYPSDTLQEAATGLGNGFNMGNEGQRGVKDEARAPGLHDSAVERNDVD